MPRPRKFTCLICGKRFNHKNRLRRHIFNHHLRPCLGHDLFRFCWCQGEFPLTEAQSFRVWEEHVRLAGGLQSHYTAHALDIGGSHGG